MIVFRAPPHSFNFRWEKIKVGPIWPAHVGPPRVTVVCVCVDFSRKKMAVCVGRAEKLVIRHVGEEEKNKNPKEGHTNPVGHQMLFDFFFFFS